MPVTSWNTPGTWKLKREHFCHMPFIWGLPQWLSGKESACIAGTAGDSGSIPGSGRSPGERHANPLQCSRLENPVDGGAWWAPGHRVAESDTTGHAHPHAPVFAFLLVDSVLVSTESQVLQESGQWPPNSVRGFSQSRSGFLLETQHVSSEPGSCLVWLGRDFRSSGSVSCLCALGSSTGQVFSGWAFHGASPRGLKVPLCAVLHFDFFFFALCILIAMAHEHAWRRKWQYSPVFLLGKSQGQGSLVGCHLWGRTVGYNWSDLAAAAAAAQACQNSQIFVGSEGLLLERRVSQSLKLSL